MKGEWPALEQKILKSNKPWAAYNYALHVKKAAWPQGEALIAKDAESSVRYELDVTHSVFTKGEAAIAKSGTWSLYHAKLVKPTGKFTAGEAAIKQAGLWEDYNAPDKIQNNYHFVFERDDSVAYGRKPGSLVNKLEVDINNGAFTVTYTDWHGKKTTENHLDYPFIGSQNADVLLALNEIKQGKPNSSTLEFWGGDWEGSEDFLPSTFKKDKSSPIPTRFYKYELNTTSAENAYRIAYAQGKRFEIGEKYIAKDLNTNFEYAKKIIHGRFIEAEPYLRKDKAAWKEYTTYINHFTNERVK